MKQRAQQNRETLLLEKKITTLRAQNADLQNEVKRLNSPEYVEQLARRDLGLVKPGENSVLVVPPKEGEPAENPDDSKKAAAPQEKPAISKKDKGNSEKNKENTESKEKKVSEKRPAPTQSQSWWQRTLGFLDNLTGQE